MTQNFSEMSDIFMPELMELDSYWRRAVEDAICDTIKGEKRLHYALKNRKKINQKLEKLGFKSGMPQLRYTKRSPLRKPSGDDEDRSDPASQDEDEPHDSKSTDSTSAKDTCRETSPERKYRSPERPLLGGGSLEKMKKSQNSFNCEPMEGNTGGLYLDEEAPEDGEDPTGKKIKWLHVRDDTDFEESDSDTSTEDEVHQLVVEKLPAFKKQKTQGGGGSGEKRHLVEEEDAALGEDKGGKELEKKLELALVKRKIVNEEQKGGLGGKKVQVRASRAKGIERRRKGQSVSSAFIQVYLEVYREMYQKGSEKEMAAEAGKRWCSMTEKERSKYGKKKGSK